MFNPTETEITEFIARNRKMHPGLDFTQARKYMRNRYDAVQINKAAREMHYAREARQTIAPTQQIVVRHAAGAGIAHAALCFGLGLMFGGLL